MAVFARAKQQLARVLPAAAAAVVAACGGPLLGGADIAYVPATVVSPVGYTQTQIDATHYTVKATGATATPPARIEQIAQARAAEIGVENKLRWFKVASVTHGIHCVDKKESFKAPTTAANYYPTVALDVMYNSGTAPPDPSWRPSGEAFEQSKAALASPSQDAPTSAEEMKSRCNTRS